MNTSHVVWWRHGECSGCLSCGDQTRLLFTWSPRLARHARCNNLLLPISRCLHSWWLKCALRFIEMTLASLHGTVNSTNKGAAAHMKGTHNERESHPCHSCGERCNNSQESAKGTSDEHKSAQIHSETTAYGADTIWHKQRTWPVGIRATAQRMM